MKPLTIAYLILAHGNPEQLARLVAALPSNSPVLIHFDRRSDAKVFELAFELLKGRAKSKFVTRHACWWGAFGIVRGTMSLIQELMAERWDFQYATLLSGSDYPIKSNNEITGFLNQHYGAEFIESFLLTTPNRWSDNKGLFRTPEKALCRHIRFRSRVLRLPGLRKLPRGLRPYGGSQWWTLSRDAISLISDFIDRTPEFVAFCKYTFIPDEFFVQTILSNSPLGERITGDNLRFAIWDRPSPPYPATLTMNDLDALLASSGHFARKFDLRIDAAIIDALAKRNVIADA